MVLIKSYPGGISLHINDTQPFEELLGEIGDKLEESRKFFKNASVAISVEGRILSLDEEKELIQTIDAHSDLQVICLVGKNEETNRKFIKALKRVELSREENNGRFYKGNVLSEQVVESEGSLVIIGNVFKGAVIAATKDIIVLGELLGEAYAGLDNCEGHFITALKMNPEKCKIGADIYTPVKAGIFDKRKSEPCIICKKDNELICEVVTSESIVNATTI